MRTKRPHVFRVWSHQVWFLDESWKWMNCRTNHVHFACRPWMRRTSLFLPVLAITRPPTYRCSFVTKLARRRDQVCLFCVHYIVEQMNGKCPACRQAACLCTHFRKFFFHTKPSGKDYVESQFRYDASVAPISFCCRDWLSWFRCWNAFLPCTVWSSRVLTCLTAVSATEGRAKSFREKQAEKKKAEWSVVQWSIWLWHFAPFMYLYPVLFLLSLFLFTLLPIAWLGAMGNILLWWEPFWKNYMIAVQDRGHSP